MQAIFGFFLILGILGSPIWISGVIKALPRRFLILDILLCFLQAVLAHAVWWFFWGGGIGGEVHLSTTWQWLLLSALLPLGVAVYKRVT